MGEASAAALPPRPPRMQCGSQHSRICSKSDFFGAHKCVRSFYHMYVDMFGGGAGCNISTDLSESRVGGHFSWHGAHEEAVWQPPGLRAAGPTSVSAPA